MKTKICSKCKKRKTISDFHKCSSAKDGLKSFCKKCALEYMVTYSKTKNAIIKRKQLTKKYTKVGRWKTKNKSSKQIEKEKIYSKSNACKAAKARYRKTERSKAGQLKYRMSPKGKASAKRIYEYQKANGYRDVYNKIRRSSIKVGANCELCKGKDNLVMHHEDYSKPLSVITLCQKCHLNLHKQKNVA